MENIAAVKLILSYLSPLGCHQFGRTLSGQTFLFKHSCQIS